MSSFITRSVQLSWGTDSGNQNAFSGGAGSQDFLTNSDSPPGCDWNPTPGALTMARLAIRVSSAPGTNFTFQPFKGIPKVDTGPSVVLLSGNTDAEGVVAVTVNAPIVAADLATEAVGWRGSSAGGSINGRTIWSYSLASPYDKYNIVAGGFSSSNFFSGSATRFLGPSTFLSSTVSGNVALAMPVAGTFKYFLAAILMQNTSGDSTYTCSLDVNGTQVISATTSNAASPAIATETTTSAPVVAGDLVNFRFVTSGPVNISHRGRVYASVGFLPA